LTGIQKTNFNNFCSVYKSAENEVFAKKKHIYVEVHFVFKLAQIYCNMWATYYVRFLRNLCKARSCIYNAKQSTFLVAVNSTKYVFVVVSVDKCECWRGVPNNLHA